MEEVVKDGEIVAIMTNAPHIRPAALCRTNPNAATMTTTIMAPTTTTTPITIMAMATLIMITQARITARIGARMMPASS